MAIFELFGGFMSEAQIDLNWLCKWLEDNSSGIYSPAKEAAYVIRGLVRKLEAAEARADKAEASISEAREQDAVIFVVFNGVIPVKAFYVENDACEYADNQQRDHALSGSWSSFKAKKFYASPVPATPIQDDKQNGKVLIDSEFVKFLNGESKFNGYWFGEESRTNGAYWWRAYLPKPEVKRS